MNPIEGVLSLYFLPFKKWAGVYYQVKKLKAKPQVFPPDNARLQVS